MKNLQIVLTSLGYRQHPEDKNKWIKPCGYILFIYLEKENHLMSYFYGVQGQFLCWNHVKCEYEKKDHQEISKTISYHENYLFHDISISPPVTLGFLTKVEQVSFMCESL